MKNTIVHEHMTKLMYKVGELEVVKLFHLHALL